MYQSRYQPYRIVGWALLSQALWLPVVGIDLHDRFQARVNELAPVQPELAGRAGPTAAISSQPTHDLLTPSSGAHRRQATTGHLLDSSSPASVGTPFNRSAAPGEAQGQVGSPFLNSVRPRPLSSGTLQALRLQRPSPGTGQPGSDVLQTPPPEPLIFRRSDLLGGPVSLNDLDSPLIPPLAAAERARLSRSGDPLAPLPAAWRAPMRQALRRLPKPASGVNPARIVHVPSTRVKRPTAVPLALQSDGTVDVLSRPDDPAVLKDIESWSNRQNPPQQGMVTPAVVKLQPLEAAPGTDGVRKPPVKLSPQQNVPEREVSTSRANGGPSEAPSAMRGDDLPHPPPRSSAQAPTTSLSPLRQAVPAAPRPNPPLPSSSEPAGAEPQKAPTASE